MEPLAPIGPLDGVLTSLIYELLDANEDTVRLAGDLPLDAAWLAHLDYLRAVHRIAHAVLAQRCSASPE